jgi:hypothetical protein
MVYFVNSLRISGRYQIDMEEHYRRWRQNWELKLREWLEVDTKCFPTVRTQKWIFSQGSAVAWNYKQFYQYPEEF